MIANPFQATFLPKPVFDFDIQRSKALLIARAGLILPHQMAIALDLPGEIDRQLPSPGSPRGYAPSAFVIPIVLMLHGGGKALDDLRELRAEVSLRKLLGIDHLPASCTVGDWLRRTGEDGQATQGLDRVNQYLTSRVLAKEGPGGYILDADATLIESEKEDAKWSYKKIKGYQPMLGFLRRREEEVGSPAAEEGVSPAKGEGRLPGLIVAQEFREGNVPPGARAVAFLKKCAARLPEGKKLEKVRADSAWYQAEVFNCCWDLGASFAIAADEDAAVKEAIRGIEKWEFYRGDREIGETVHTMNGTRKAFRLIVQRWPKSQPDLFDQDPYCYHAIATDGEEAARKVIEFYNQRGESENWIKELKEGFGMDWMPCGESCANAVYFLIGVIAYNLFVAMKALALPGSWRKHTVGTVRWKLYQIAGHVLWESSRVRLKLATTVEKVALLLQAATRVRELAAV